MLLWPKPLRAEQPQRRSSRRSKPEVENEYSWPDQPFDFGLFEKLSGSVELAAGKMDLGQGVKLTSGRMVAEFSGKGLHFKNIAGQFGGGKLSASLDLIRGAAGVSTSARVQLREVDLRRFRRLVKGGKPPMNVSVAQGSFDMDIEVDGRGLSPRGVVSVLKGNGVAQFHDFSLMHFSPEAVEVASNAMLQGRRRPDKDRLEASIVENLEKGVLAHWQEENKP